MAGEKSREELKKQLIDWKAKIESLQQPSSAIKPEMQAKYMDTVAGLKQTIQTLELFVKQLEKEDAAGWEKEMGNLDKMMNDLDEGYRRALVYFP
ncbi:MAG: hypothetical protein WAK95_14480 [Desulfobacterales bacterium]